MYRLWETKIRPLLGISMPKKNREIGSDPGKKTGKVRKSPGKKNPSNFGGSHKDTAPPGHHAGCLADIYGKSEIDRVKFRLLEMLRAGDLKELLEKIRQHIRWQKEAYIIRKSGLFDRKYYLRQYPDVSTAGIDPIWHYVTKDHSPVLRAPPQPGKKAQAADCKKASAK
jgi:hypothetical protein